MNKRVHGVIVEKQVRNEYRKMEALTLLNQQF
ncbi:hypothetical protein [Coxiella burnetii]|uniref:Uncharacterized protein n=2 Tax=Coxiella burnetii TaxID=777 RepID=Q83E66_COXBU|nr:hypothetical protein [Coxiella burnetii]NP_819500.1 hypothetical protein CBU_0465 [Coxiella burnetii RSA 493]AAO90014.1 hypothetical protein CBU_0465 [Coxiella burnetii RSA 493]ACI23191.1 hypothetical protein CBUD_1611a [Coxiella burnetii Dugway 5J108-111]ACJ18842.1 hypothetical protein CbuG_1548 [Coxiella burnetii CbuG_Q212]ACJ20569.1 hypothetical protein CbuK_1395 [Coxiella burnetii CbuK_Q154]AML49603.1 hypothetical protein AUR58_10850 [Coxiella burnetii]